MVEWDEELGSKPPLLSGNDFGNFAGVKPVKFKIILLITLFVWIALSNCSNKLHHIFKVITHDISFYDR